MNITVVIPPVSESVRAQENGATGLWSIVNGNNGLMIDAPNSVTGDEDLKVALLTPAAPHLQIRSFGGQFSSAWTTVDRSGRLSRATLNIPLQDLRSEEHTSELQSLMRISYAVFCLTKKKNHPEITNKNT